MSVKHHIVRSTALWIFVLAMVAAILIWWRVPPTWNVSQTLLATETNEAGETFILFGVEQIPAPGIPALRDSELTVENLTRLDAEGNLPEQLEQIVFAVDQQAPEGEQLKYYLLAAYRHWRYWSFLPALTAIALCWITKEPLSALLAGIITGAVMIGKPNVLDSVLIPSIGTPTAATILVLYLWLLGGLLGIWDKTGASVAFADYMTERFVRGPRSAKLVAWLLGVLFFQGGTVSSVLVGTTVRPVADKEKVSHEELSLIVDSTSSPIAVLLAFNAWPIYVQAFLVVPGVAALATEAGRIEFFFSSILFSFYAIFAVLFTLLISLEVFPTMPPKLKAAIKRSRETGQLDAPGSEPLSQTELPHEHVPAGYPSHVLDFVVPLFALLAVAVGTYFVFQSPKVLWAFTVALLLAVVMASIKGMHFKHLMDGIVEGQKSVVMGSIILLLAITIGNLSQEVGGGRYLVSLLGGLQWHWILPMTSFLIAVVIAFSTGTSWATFAVTLPLVMPLAHAVGINNGLEHPELYLTICFAACLNGGVFGDQCSPISDTTILSSLCTGADLMDHVKTQFPVAVQAAVLAIICWTTIACFC
jgi:Na+/H+ antiporter NhaC